MTHHTQQIATIGLLGLCALAGLASGCRGDRSDKPPRQFFPDMDDSPKWKPQTRTDFYSDHRSMRPTVDGTVPFGRSTSPDEPGRADALLDDVPFFTGKASDAKDAAAVPMIPARVKVTAELLKRGEERFNIYCSACHGYDGKGAGTVGVMYSVPPANLMDAKFTDRSTLNGADGHIFDVIMNGWNNNMPGYRHSIRPMDAWAIVAHLRAMQKKEAGTIDQVPEAERARLMQSKPAAAPAPAAKTEGAK